MASSITSAVLIGIVGAILGGVAQMVFYRVAFRRKWKLREGKLLGFNFSSDLKCPVCGRPAPAFRKATNLHQAFWGGWTCEDCDTEYDKWGKVRKGPAP
jgi:hypothetical protein